MNFTEMNRGDKCDLRTVPEKCRMNSFVVVTDDGEEFELQKLKFQKHRDIPETLPCYVKDVKDGYVTVGQDIAKIIPQFYKQGGEYTFRIRSRAFGGKAKKSYEVEDEYGLFFKLNSAPAGLPIGKKIQCRIERLDGVYVLLKYIGSADADLRLRFEPLAYWLDAVGVGRMEQVVRDNAELYPEYTETVGQYRSGNANWLFTMLDVFSSQITHYLISYKGNKQAYRHLFKAMDIAGRLCLYVIEGSGYLGKCDTDRRTGIQKAMSRHIELFKQFTQAAKLIEENRDEEFISGIFTRLKQSGYLYRPDRQFRIMMTILRLRPELINKYMTELFEALHLWPSANWKCEPFRTALVDQLEIFITQNIDYLDTLPDSEYSTGDTDQKDSKLLNKVIRAIAIQSLLASAKDNVDIQHNKAMFYRYLTYYHGSNAELHAQEVDNLLYKAVGSVLGNEYSHDFGWNDTSAFQILLTKASNMRDAVSAAATLPKVYNNGDISLELRPAELLIRERRAEDNDSVLPASLMSWMKPTILMKGNVQTPSAARRKNLKAYKQMWADIERGLTAENRQEDAGEVRKQAPEDGDAVMITIDYYKIDYTRPEWRRLRLHATIVDDGYEGEGWINVGPDTFVPWLNEYDIPNNYDGDMSIFCDENGNQLLYPAVVLNAGAECTFTLKRQINEMLRESAEVGDISRACIRDVDYRSKKYICLSDNGYTLKVPFWEGETLSKGTVVMVRYLGEDHQDPSPNLYMEGELIDVMSGSGASYGKKAPLAAIAKNLGEENPNATDDNGKEEEVIDAREVMSDEDVAELVRMLQRKAFTEKEYFNAFNYLGLAALLAKIIGDDSLYGVMRLHQELLIHLESYAREKRVDLDELSKHSEAVKGHPMLAKLYSKLEIVASLDSPENNTDLWEFANHGDETERRLASLALSFNLIADDAEEEVQKKIKNNIASILNVNSSETVLKSYGEEYQHLEFKSSLVFTNKKADHMRPRPEAQEQEIMEIICGFLNSTGGTLYIGVNDLGYEAGLADDKRFRRSRGKRDTIDAMIVDLESVIHNRLPGFAADHIQISSDQESTKGVIRVEITPVDRPVELDGKIFVRHSSSTRPKTGLDRDDFIAARKQNYDEMMARLMATAAAESREEAPADNDAAPQTQEAAPAPQRKASPKAAAEAEDGDKIQTGMHRLNILHDYEPGFIHPAYYLYFSDRTIYASAEDRWEDGRLSLAVSEKETGGWMVVTYDSKTVCRVDMREVNDLVNGGTIDLPADAKITHVNLADRSNYLVSFIRNASGILMYRLDKVDDLPQSREFSSKGNPLCDGDCTILMQDIVPADKADALFPKALEQSKNLQGTLVHSKNRNQPDMSDVLEMLKPLKPVD